MPVSKALIGYFQILKDYHDAPQWQKTFMLRGSLLTACNTTTPETAQRNLRRFWYAEAVKHGVEVKQLQNWT